MAQSPALRVLHLTPRHGAIPGGVELFFGKLGTYLAGRGHHVQVWTTDAGEVAGFSGGGRHLGAAGPTDGVTVRRFPVRRVPARRLALTAAHLLPLGRGWRSAFQRWTPVVPGLWRAARGENVAADVVHAAPLPYSVFLWAGWRAARRTRAGLVYTPFLHLGHPRDPRDRTRRRYLSPLNVSLLQEADLVFSQTESEREALVAAGLRRDRVALLGMGVDAGDCTGGNRERARQGWGVPRDAVVVGHLANMSRDKGTLDLLDAAVGLEELPIHLVLAGPEMPSFARVRPRLANRARVTILGPLDDLERRDFYAGIDVFALPSYVDSFGIVLLEAGCNGVPSLAYRLGGPAEVIDHGASGLLAEPGDIAGLRAAIGRMAEDAPLRASLGEAARRRSEARPWSLALERVERAYFSLTDRSHACP